MKLIKLKEDHYIIVDDSEIKIGCIVAEKLVNGSYEMFTIHTLNDINSSCQNVITHSTQPLEVKITDEGIHLPDWSKIKALSPRVVKELLGEVDVEKKAKECIGWYDKNDDRDIDTFIKGYTQCLEDNKEKKYTLEDLEAAACFGMILEKLKCDKYKLQNDEEWKGFIQSLHPKTEWEVEFIDGKLKLKS